MTDVDFDRLATILEQDDDDLKTDLPAALDGVENELDDLLMEHPNCFEQLSLRMCTLDGIAEYAETEPETIDRYLDILWGGLGLISENVEAVQEEVTEEFSVAWACADSAVTFHMQSDPETGTVSGGPGSLDDPRLTFEGDTDTLFSMLYDPEFDPVQGFMDGSFELDGPVNDAMTYARMMESVTSNVEKLN